MKLSFLNDQSNEGFVKKWGSAEKLYELVLSSHFNTTISRIAVKYAVPCVYFDGGTLVVDSYAWDNSSDTVNRFITALFDRGFEVNRVRIISSEELKAYKDEQVLESGDVEREIDQAESLRQFKHLMERAYKLGSEDVFVMLSAHYNTAYALFKVEGELKSGSYSLKDYAFGKSMCAAIYDGADTLGEGSGNFDDVSRQEKTIPYTLYDDKGLMLKKLQIRFSKTKTSKAGELLIVMRIQKELIRFEDSGLSDDLKSTIRFELQKAKGLVITSGATGSGKSNTILSMLLECPRQRFYQTFEDPIEIETPREYTNIRQNTLDMRIGYHEQLKGIMRQSIDGIFVQEIRDHETASFMMHVVKSGHFGLSTTHANCATGIIDRLVDLGITRADLASPGAINLLGNQSLIRLLCPCCKVSVSSLEQDSPEQYEQHIKIISSLGMGLGMGDYFVKSDAGCESCDFGSEKGRQLILELIKVTSKDREFIRTGDEMGWRKHLSESGFSTVAEQVQMMVMNGLVDPIRALELVEN